MITNILLGLILGVVITSFIILNIKINRIDDYVKRTFTNTNIIDSSVDNHYKLTNILLDRFNKKVLNDNEHCDINANNYNNIMVLLKSRFKDLDNATDSIYDRFNTIHADIEKYIAAEHIITRRQIEKQAKISSKINPKQKQSKSTQK